MEETFAQTMLKVVACFRTHYDPSDREEFKSKLNAFLTLVENIYKMKKTGEIQNEDAGSDEEFEQVKQAIVELIDQVEAGTIDPLEPATVVTFKDINLPDDHPLLPLVQQCLQAA